MAMVPQGNARCQSTCCVPLVPSAAQGLFPGGQMWQPKIGTQGGGARGGGGLTVFPRWKCVLPGLERS